MNKRNQRKIVNIFLPIVLSICFGCSKEPSHCMFFSGFLFVSVIRFNFTYIYCQNPHFIKN